ncbi:MAG: efflux RND transporter periplasmic adaptor subunit [Magnetococcales bacterium]|nr:efflux RND transporter periplasmic adaptor subunit [Magnetococcales bacterium]MBF0438597.1 efflux RND transporter periplasmic adaptor subunit [Magnetococcales bacterium]
MRVGVLSIGYWVWLIWFAWPAMGWTEEVRLQARALLAAQRETILSSRMVGRVEKLAVKEGDTIRQGQMLVNMDCAIHEARQAKVEAELKASRIKLEVQKRLEKLQSGSAQEVGLSAAEVQKMEAELAEMRATVAMCVIHAPFSGRVTAIKVGLQQSVAQGVPLVEILDDTSLEVRLIVPSKWLSWLRVDAPFTLHIDETGQEYPAKVVRIGARIDPASQSLSVTGVIAGKQEGVMAGMSGTALFVGVGP